MSSCESTTPTSKQPKLYKPAGSTIESAWISFTSKDIRGGTHLFLNLVDDGTVYQAATRLTSRSEEAVITALVNGWFTYFGPPDELAIDAEGAFRGMRFETLNAQLNVAVRCCST